VPTKSLIVNCIIASPQDESRVMFVRTKKFRDLSLPGALVPDGANARDLLVASVKDRTGITIECFKRQTYDVPFSSKDTEFNRTVYVSESNSGTPTTMGDMNKYGIEIYSPDLLFNKDWTVKKMYKLAPGIHKTLLLYYIDVAATITSRFPSYTPLKEVNMEKVCLAAAG